MPVQIVAAKIKEARGEMTRTELASASGLSFHTIRAYEEGTRTPPLKTLERLAEATGKPVSWFFSEDGVAAA